MYYQMNPYKTRPVAQKHGTRFIVQYPPPRPLKKNDLDNIYELPYEYESHPDYSKEGGVKGLETVRFSITSHRGCPGECSFCALYFHQGRIVSMAAKERPFMDMITVSYVYTPVSLRNQGYATTCVGMLTELLLKSYRLVTLYTDLSNPTSNSIYQKIGYRPVIDSVVYLTW